MDTKFASITDGTDPKCPKIVLVRSFRKGVSTTFNTFCGGREISPMGIDGLKTAAAMTSAVSIPEHEDEYVEIFWKTEYELLLSVIGFTNSILAAALSSTPELGTAYLRKCIDSEWASYERDRRNYKPEQYESLQIATLILNYSNDPKLKEYRSKNRFTLQEMKSFMTYPADWALRWSQGRNPDFSLEEILFVFVSHAVCHIHSEILERLGCVITESPSLFVNQWETDIFHKMLREADVIIYPLGGNRTIDYLDLKAIEIMVQSEQAHKLFFAINARKAKKHVEGVFRPADHASIKSRGIDLDEDDIMVFHSRLAFEAESFPYTEDKMRWKKNVRSDLASYLDLDPFDPSSQEKIDALIADPEALMEISGFPNLINKIETYLHIDNKNHPRRQTMKKEMTPAIYEEKRNSLMTLLEGIIKTCPKLDEETKDELNAAVDKLKRNSFEIVLVGEFQGGKSTTFNTICGGRTISPMGIGIKTSATKISAMSIPENKEEYVDVFWKTDRELLQTMMNFIEYSFVEHPERRSKFYDSENNLVATLKTPEIFAIARECIDREWEIYESNRKAYDPKEEGKLDLLQISTLILNFYNNQQLNTYREKTRVTVSELQTMVTFPVDWLMRWAQSRDAVFSLEETQFVFLSSAFCHIHSKNLERLGCIITDCPGLFAGPWDTEVANEAMRKADAILYLLGGVKAIQEADLKALSAIVQSNQEHKLFFAINARKAKKHVEGAFRPADHASIKSRGIDLDEDDIMVFHSLLAFEAKSFPYLEDKTGWKKETRRNLAHYLDLDPFEEADAEKINGLVTNPDELADVSDFTSLVNRIETSIVAKKSEAILVKGGTDKASNALENLSGALQARENGAMTTRTDREAEVKAAWAKLKKFQEEVKVLIGGLDKPVLAESLADNFVEEVFIRNTAAIANSITDRIKVLFTHSTTLCQIIFDVAKKRIQSLYSDNCDIEKGKIHSILESSIKDSIYSITTNAIGGWCTNLIQGNNLVFNSTYQNELNNIQERIRERWDSQYQGGNSLLKGLVIDFSWNPSLDGEQVTSRIGDSEVKISVQAQIIKALSMRVAAMVTAIIGGAILVLAVGFLFDAIFMIVAGVALVLLGKKYNQWLEEKLAIGLERAFRVPLQQKVTEYFRSDETTFVLKENAREIIFKFVESLKTRCDQSLEKQKKDLEKRVKDSLALERLAIGDLQRIADECKTIRETQIDPAWAQVSAFADELKPYFASAADIAKIK